MIAWMLKRVAARVVRFGERLLRHDADPQIIALKRKGVALLRQNASVYHDFSRRLFLAEDVDGLLCSLIDVSDKQTISWLWRKYLRHLPRDRRPLVIDLGANDGLIGSMSLNFVQLGWNAVLVEPVPQMMALARENLGAYSRDGQSLIFVEAAIGANDGEVQFETEVGNDLSQMEGHVVATPTATSRAVRMISADTLLARPDVAALIAEGGSVVLSVDIEGQDAVVTARLLELGLRPDIIIVETVHVGSEVDAVNFARYGYKLANHIGWNDIYAYERRSP